MMLIRSSLLASLLMVASFGGSHDGRGEEASKLPGLWYVTTFFGPQAPGTPVIQAFMKVSADGTALFDSTAETGENPVFAFNPQGTPLGEFTPAHAVWSRVRPASSPRHAREYELRFASFSDGGGDGFNMLVFTLRVRLDSKDTFSGKALAADAPCDVGALGEPICPRPQDVGFPVVEGNPDAFPVIGERILFER